MDIMWALALECPFRFSGTVEDAHMPMLTDQEGYIILFRSRQQAEDYLGAHPQNDLIEEILIIPEMEAIL